MQNREDKQKVEDMKQDKIEEVVRKVHRAQNVNKSFDFISKSIPLKQPLIQFTSQFGKQYDNYEIDTSLSQSKVGGNTPINTKQQSYKQTQVMV